MNYHIWTEVLTPRDVFAGWNRTSISRFRAGQGNRTPLDEFGKLVPSQMS